MPQSPHDGLRQHVATRRKQLQLSIVAAAAAAGINRATWSALEQGTRDTESYTYGGVERALNWAPGSIDRILDGGEPVLLDASRQDVGARLTEIRDDPDLPGYLRRQAQAALDAITALVEASEAERRNRRRAG